MILKGLFILLTIFYLQNGVRSDSPEALFEITDINSLKKIIVEHYNTTSRNIDRLYKIGGPNLTLEEQNKTAAEFYLEMIELSDRGRDIYNLISSKGRLDILYKAILHDLNQLSSIDVIASLNTRKVNYCMHSWGLYWYSVTQDSFNHKLDLSYTHFFISNSIRQIFYDLVFYLSHAEKKEDNRYDYCKRTSSFHQGLYNIYKQFVIKNFQEFSVQYFSSMSHTVCELSLSSLTLYRYQKGLFYALKKIITVTKEVLYNTKYYTYPCDSTYYKKTEEETDLELERMVQTIIIAEKDLSNTGSCSHNCNLKSIKNTNMCDTFLDCHYSTPVYQITKLKNSSRRYGYFIGYDGENKKQYGDPARHFDNREKPINVSSSYSWGTMRYCDYCICTCAIEQSHSPHVTAFVSLRDQVSDIENNKAVVGVKFVKKDGMIHIQILESEVLPYGKIGDESWKELEKFHYNASSEQFYNNDRLGGKIIYQRGKDYARPDIIHLNDIIEPGRHVVTGVRFGFAEDLLNHPTREQGSMELQIRLTPLDFLRGKLINLDQSSWLSPKKPHPKDELILENPDNPKYVKSNTDPIITSNKFVRFRASDLKKDAGQSTVPFFDGRETKMHKSLLGGVGLVHRGHQGSGGHLAFKIFDFDMSLYFDIDDHNPDYLLD